MIVIDHERYGERAEFASIAEAQQAIRSCGPEFSGVTLEIRTNSSGDWIYDERDELVGRVEQ